MDRPIVGAKRRRCLWVDTEDELLCGDLADDLMGVCVRVPQSELATVAANGEDTISVLGPTISFIEIIYRLRQS